MRGSAVGWAATSGEPNRQTALASAPLATSNAAVKTTCASRVFTLEMLGLKAFR